MNEIRKEEKNRYNYDSLILTRQSTHKQSQIQENSQKELSKHDYIKHNQINFVVRLPEV
jgi:hypothetical protein